MPNKIQFHPSNPQQIIVSTGNAINVNLLDIDTESVASVSVQLTGPFTGTVTFQGANNQDYTGAISLKAQSASGGAYVSTATTAGIYNLHATTKYLRVRVTAYTSGTITATTVLYAQKMTIPDPVNSVSLIAGSALIGDVSQQYRTGGGCSVKHVVSNDTTNATLVKSSAGKVIGWYLSNPTATWKYVKLHNKSSAPTAGSGVYMTIGIPPNDVSNRTFDGGIAFTPGIGYTIVNGVADTDTTAVALNDVVGDIFYV